MGGYATLYPISILLLKFFRGLRVTTAVPVVLLMGGVFLNMAVRVGDVSVPETKDFGGPVSAESTLSVEERDALLVSVASVLDFPASPNEDDIVGFLLETEDSLVNPTHPLRGLLPSREGTLSYRVKEGDSLSSIAKDFGITLDTILATNTKVKERIQPGQELIILPVSGVLHIVEEGESVESIARLYSADINRVREVNEGVLSNGLRAGEALIIAGARRQSANLATLPSRSLPNLGSYFQPPATGWNWGRIHGNNGVDIANVRGTSIFAAAEGLVVEVGSPTKWNGGYGGFVRIEHPNGTETLYAHNEANLVEPGTFVKKGELIASMGNTGNTHGPTGYHLHFEVKGAQNLLAKQ